MGMYDNLHISNELLPLSKSEKEKIGMYPGWQTKDFDCILTDVHITDNGELKIRKHDYNTTRFATITDREFVNFYTLIDNDWFEFNAKFKNGKLKSIKKIIKY